MQFQMESDVDDINQSSHKLFVEGKDNQAIDPIVIKELLINNDLTNIDVQVMGRCDNVRSAAEALFRHHPSYYFLIDRDEQNTTIVENSWQHFPDPNSYNMIIWRKRELENYFIDPDFLSHSAFITVSKTELEEKILAECNQRLFIDAANLTILHLHREVKKPFCHQFTDVLKFKNEQDGVLALSQLTELTNKSTEVSNLLEQSYVKQIYSNFVHDLTDGIYPLQYNCGNWLERMSGKEIFHNVVSGSEFKVKDRHGKSLQGDKKYNQIAKDLLKKLPLNEQPSDFQQLVSLLKERTI